MAMADGMGGPNDKVEKKRSTIRGDTHLVPVLGMHGVVSRWDECR